MNWMLDSNFTMETSHFVLLLMDSVMEIIVSFH